MQLLIVHFFVHRISIFKIVCNAITISILKKIMIVKSQLLNIIP
jgi:hypothetical protein